MQSNALTMQKKRSKKTKSKKSAKKLLAATSLASTLLLAPSSKSIKALPDPLELRIPYGLLTASETKKIIKQILDKSKDELDLANKISTLLGLKATFNLEGNQLNHQQGIIALEQHLKRYPGDTLAKRQFREVGLAPNKGAWGYFATSKATLASVDIQKEKYYLAVQTMYLPNWNQDTKRLKNWYKHRKVLVINQTTGASVVAVIADAGPAKWTGKQFGGSPAVMHSLGLYPQHKKGQVYVMFVDDPDEKIPLGPITQPLSKPQPLTV